MPPFPPPLSPAPWSDPDVLQLEADDRDKLRYTKMVKKVVSSLLLMFFLIFLGKTLLLPCVFHCLRD